MFDWEFELRAPCEDDESDDVFDPEDDEFIDCPPCASEACLGNWLGALA